MASGFSVLSGADLDSVFAPLPSGWAQTTATEFFTGDGRDLNQRYAPLSTGTAAAATGFVASSGSDLNAFFAAYGTTGVKVGTQPSNVSGSAAAGYPSGTVTSGFASCSGTKGSGSYSYTWICSNCSANTPSNSSTSFSASVSASSTTNASAYCQISDGVTTVNTNTISVTLTNTSPKSQNFTMTAVTWTNTGGTHIGANVSGGHGSITNATLPSGGTINALVDNSAGNTSFGISGLTSDPGQGYFSSIVSDGQTRTSASATYAYSGGLATWTWPGSTIGFVSGDSYPSTINF